MTGKINNIRKKDSQFFTLRRNISLHYRYLHTNTAYLFKDFYRAMQGPLTAFAFYFPNSRYYEKEYVGLGTGFYNLLILPRKYEGYIPEHSLKGQLFENGVPVSDLIWDLASTGPAGELYALWNTGLPTLGAVYNYTFNGRLKVNARFEAEPIIYSEVKNSYLNFDVKLVGLQASSYDPPD